MILNAIARPHSLFESTNETAGNDYYEQYNNAQPFPHIVFDEFLNEEVLNLCLEHFPGNEKAQASYNRSQEKRKFEYKPEVLAPPLRALFYSFNSLPFINFLQKLTGINGLIPDPYFLGAGLHEVQQSGYLNIHADFNHHEQLDLERRINVLIYLNKDWKEEYGGCLELWDERMQSCKARIVPSFNRCVIFNTSSVSMHGNPEPVAHPEGRPRRAIALYYYTATWDAARVNRTTRFNARPNTHDTFDFKVRAREVMEDISPPLLLRTARRFIRLVHRQRARPAQTGIA
jgi:Rps23 Pro-64 3,4-dihydroxylase Tpa1-like proline 4-hydroxylase